MVEILGLHHAQITIPPGKEPEARAFYCGVLGFREVPKPESLGGRGGLWLAAGDFSLHIGVEEGVDRNRSKAHLAYAVAGIESIRQRLADAGVTVLDSIPIPGCDRFEFRDPFGNRVEIVEPH